MCARGKKQRAKLGLCVKELGFNLQWRLWPLLGFQRAPEGIVRSRGQREALPLRLFIPCNQRLAGGQ